MKDLPCYLELTKPRILSMVLVTTALGFFLGAHGVHPFLKFLLTLAGVGCSTGGAATLNNYFDRTFDAKMSRTRQRCLAAGRLGPNRALTAGVGLVLAGVLLLVTAVNILTGFLVLLAAFLYVVVYTPLKRITWLNTSFGAIPGAIPPMAGWAAATGRIDLGAWVLFGILFAWQHPHFFAIAWMFRDDYRAAGFKMLPVVEQLNGTRTFRQTIAFSILLIAISILPGVLRMAGWFYFWGALLLGFGMLGASACFAQSQSVADARRLLRASVLYLPVILLLIVLDAA